MDGNNIVCDYAISFSQAALGAIVEVLTLDGKEKLKIPPGVQSGTFFNLKGKGLPYLNSRRRGDHLVRVIIATPIRLDTTQKKLLKTLAEMGEEDLGIKKRTPN